MNPDYIMVGDTLRISSLIGPAIMVRVEHRTLDFISGRFHHYGQQFSRSPGSFSVRPGCESRITRLEKATRNRAETGQGDSLSPSEAPRAHPAPKRRRRGS